MSRVERVIGNRPNQVANYNDEKDLANIHSLHARFEEKEQINTTSLEDTVTDLETIYDTYSGDDALKIEHIKKWSEVLSKHL